jgi:peptidyl-prolyl cis-trans isomerase SDCCAG10
MFDLFWHIHSFYRQLNVLSFGDEVEEEENEAASFVQDKIKSIHDVLDDPRFLKVEPQVEHLVSIVPCYF